MRSSHLVLVGLIGNVDGNERMIGNIGVRRLGEVVGERVGEAVKVEGGGV